MKVLFHGAGASRDAGYPLTSELLKRMEGELSKPAVPVGTRSGWNDFQDFRGSFGGPLGRLMGNPNPEIMLSVPDLVDSAYIAERKDRINRLVAAIERREGLEAEESWEVFTPDFFVLARRAKRGFVAALAHCFGIWHWRDLEDQGPRSYLHEHLRRLDRGDAVITTNWDTLLERTLLEQGRWSPGDGWGIPFDVVDAFNADRPLPRRVCAKSEIRVLKLHGSYGWHFGGGATNGTTEIHLGYAMFLQVLPVETESGEQVCLRDANEPDLPARSRKLAVMYPSYLKSIQGQQMQEVWSEAIRAIASADEVEIIGSSLPSSDVAIHTLLMPLRSRLDAGDVKVYVRTPDTEAQWRWERFLGERVCIDDRPLGRDDAP